MAIETINVGNLANDGLGDDLRTAFQKVNNNFNYLTTELSVSGQNIGSGGVGIFKQKVDENLQLKKIAAGDATVVIVDDPATDTVKITAPLQNAFTSIIAGNDGAVSATGPTGSVSLVAGDNITITKAGQNITITADLLSGQLLGDLDLNSYEINGIGDIDINGTITANNFVGNVHGIDIRPINTAVFDYDFGTIVQGTYSSITEFLFVFGDYDFGTITSPNSISLDLGTI
jgi:hypothetical protein